ncbi:alpha/beta hydrolase [Amycolatopsis nigrescens]|uniref:alpha/beta hydrolase n=1 Tax=Amycolatopsis nigrescens TaxID=381445 RepID=UPI000377200C|nr:alpha/beta hydrolase family protein [Amycolatopsis nigrescens]
MPFGRIMGVVSTLTALVAAAVVVPSLAAAEPDAAPVVADDGARVVKETAVDARTLDLEIASPALGENRSVRLLLPTGWTERPTRTWPLLYLLPGCCADEDYRTWTEYTDAQRFLADKNVLTVLPSDGRAGMFSRWWNQGVSPAPDWEAFHVTEVRQILERGYGAGDRRAAAGLSIGGFGAMAYAFRNRGMFGAAAAFSASIDTLQGWTPGAIQGILQNEGFDPADLWGDPVLNRPLWSEHNPADHPAELRGVALYVACGNGEPGPLDPPGQEPEQHEALSLASSQSFTDRLRANGVPVTTHYYGPGTHDWAYWERELHSSWPTLARGLGLPA